MKALFSVLLVLFFHTQASAVITFRKSVPPERLALQVRVMSEIETLIELEQLKKLGRNSALTKWFAALKRGLKKIHIEAKAPRRIEMLSSLFIKILKLESFDDIHELPRIYINSYHLCERIFL